MGFADKIEAAQSHARGDHRIAHLYEQWLSGNPKYTTKAKDFAYGEWGSGRMEGPVALRASEGGECPRMRVMRLIGFRQAKPTTTLRNTFATGSFLHLKWQMAGLSAGWLTECEVPFYAFDGLVRGKADGITEWGAVVDFKTAASYFYRAFEKAPKPAHVDQVIAACSALGSYKAHLIYENKDTGAYAEHVIDVTDEMIERVRTDAEVAAEAKAAKRLPPILEGCVSGTSPQFKRCFFHEQCHGADLTATFEGMWDK
jgi:hypothetical protein